MIIEKNNCNLRKNNCINEILKSCHIYTNVSKYNIFIWMNKV